MIPPHPDPDPLTAMPSICRPFIAAAFACALALSQSATAADSSKTDASRTLATLADRFYEAQVRFDPLYSGTLAGDNRFDDQLPITIAPEHRSKRFAMYHDVQRQLAAIDRNSLAAAH